MKSPTLLGSLTQRKQQTAEQSAAEPNPLKQATAKEEEGESADEPKVMNAVAETEAQPAGGAAESERVRLVSHDLDTLKMIEQELQFFPAEERDKLYEDFKTLDSSMARVVLRNMRMMREASQKQQQNALVADGGSGAYQAGGTQGGHSTASQPTTNTTNLAPQYGTEPSAQSPAMSGNAGLGAASPWNEYSQNPSATRNANTAGPSSPIGYPTETYRPTGPVAGTANANSQVKVGQNRDPYAANAGNGAPTFGHSAMSQPSHSPAHSTNAELPLIVAGKPSDARAGEPSEDLGIGALTVATPPADASTGINLGNLPADPRMETAMTHTGNSPNALGPAPTEFDAAANPGDPLSNTNQPSHTMGRQFGVPPLGSPANMAASKWHEELQRLISIAEAEAARTSIGTTEQEMQRYLEQQVNLRMLYLMGGQQERALEAIPGLDAADQEFWQQMFWGIANYFDYEAMPHADDRTTQTVAQVRSAVQRLQENARLELQNVNFCHKIASFGSYEGFQRDEFTPGQPVLVYAEVENFKSEPTSDGQYRTLLRSTIEVYKAGPSGDLVEQFEFPATEDLCRNYRRDYFHSYEFAIPKRISLGPHVLKLTVEDQLSQKVATYTLNFTVK